MTDENVHTEDLEIGETDSAAVTGGRRRPEVRGGGEAHAEYAVDRHPDSQATSHEDQC